MADYMRHVDEVIGSLQPENSAILSIGLNVADISWRLARWFRVEHEAHARLLEEQVRTSEPSLGLGEIKGALTMLNKLIEVHEAVPAPEPRSLGPFLSGCRSIAAAVDSLSVRPLRAARYSGAVDALADAAEKGDLGEAYKLLGDVAVQLASELTSMVKPAEERLQKLNEQLAGMTTPDEKLMKRLARYHSMLSKAMREELDLVSKVREVTRRKKAKKSGSSFGTDEIAAKRLLRVVR